MTTRLLPLPTLLRFPTADRDLLRSYAQAGDPTAFAELARRYSELAHRAAADVCPAMADDTAQAVLTLLGRKAEAVAGRESAAGWVFETARRLALKARTAAARRAKHEARAASPNPPPDPLDALSFGEVRAAVAEEVARLPDELRVPLVLCYWRGDSQSAAAAQLECSLSTLKRRLDAGRDRLAARLARRGFTGAAVLAVLTALACRTSRSMAGPAALPQVARPTVVPAGVPKSTLVGLTATAIAIVGLALSLAPAGDPTPPPPAPKPVEAAKAPAAPVDAFGDPLPPGAIARLGTVRFRTADFPKQLGVSPDGKRIVSTQSMQHVRLTVWEADTGRPIREVELSNYPQPEAICWPVDGRGLAAFKVGQKDYVVWEFTDPEAKPPIGDQSNSLGLGSFSASAFSPDGSLIAGGERAGTELTAGKLQVWPIHSGRSVREATPRFTVEMADGFVAMMFTPDGKRLVGLTQGRQPDRFVPAGAGQPNGFIEPGRRAESVNVFVWDAVTGKQVTNFEIAVGLAASDFWSAPICGAISPDGKILYTSTHDAHVKALDLISGKPRFDVQVFGPPKMVIANDHSPMVGQMAVTPDGNVILVAEFQGRTVGLDAATGKVRWRGGQEQEGIHSVAVFPDSRRFALGHGRLQIGVYDATTGKPLVKPDGPRGGLTAVGFSSDGNRAVTGEWNGLLRWWDLDTGRLTCEMAADVGGTFHVNGFSPDGRRGVGLSALFDTATGKFLASLGSAPRRRIIPCSMVWLPDGTVIVPDAECTAARFSADGRLLVEYVFDQPLVGSTGPRAEGVAASPDGKTIVLAGEGPPEHGVRSIVGWVNVFDAVTGKKVREWQSKGTGGFTSAAFLPDGSRIVLGRRVWRPTAVLDRTAALVLYDPATGDAVTPFDAPDPAAGDRLVRSVAVSPNGAQVASVEGDDSLTVYETATGAIRRRLKGHRGAIDQVAFTPDGGRLVSVSDDGTGLVWDMAPPRPVAAPAASEAERSKRWAALLATDAEAAHRAMGDLAADPAGTVRFLKAHLKSTPAPTYADIDRLLAGLAANVFADREAAARDLDALGRLAVAKVRDRLPAVTSAEVRQRLEEFLKRHDRPGRSSGYRLREVRAVELLESIGTPEPRDLLKDLARGDSTLAVAAASAEQRLGRR